MNESICKNKPYHTNPESSFSFRSNEAYVDENNDSDDGVDENHHNNFHKWNNFMSFKPKIPDTPVYKSKPIISKQHSQQSKVKKGSMPGASTGLYKGTNLVAVAMDGNNQIVPIAFGICKGETGPCWSWWMSVLRECIGDNPNLLIISDRHAAIALAVQNEFPLAFHAICCRHLMMNLSLKNKKRKDLFWKICKAYTREDFAASMNLLQIVQPDAYKKLCDARPERWSRAHCPLIRYNYMTSNSVESVNACSVIYRKEPVLKLAETYRAMVQQCTQSGKKSMKSTKWVVKGVNEYQYEVSDGQYIREVNLQAGTCECRKWQLSGIPCGHVIAVTRFLGLTDCVQYVSDWFKKPKYQGTYSESIHFLGNMQQWEFPQNIQKAIPPRMDNPQPGRPKNTKRIQSQGEEPRVIHCSRCTQAGHRRDQCNKPFVVEPPGNIRTQNVQDILRNNEPSFYDPNQHYDNTFHTFNQYTTQPYDQHFTNTSQAYDGHQTESSQMYEQYNSQQYDVQHLDDLNTNGSNSLVPLADAIQERDRILMYTQHNRLHVYVSRVELSTLVVAEQHKDEKNKTENQEKPSCSKKLFD
ncbi:transposase, MuDR, MULE transposase domain protein [Tanacetum coccineum]